MTVSVSSTPPAMNSEMKVITRFRSLNRDSGTRGWSALRSAMTKPMPRATAATPAPMTNGSVQPRGGPWVNTSTAAVHPRVASSAPVMSSLRRSWRVSSSLVTAIQLISAPIGRLMGKARRQLMTVSAPPMTSPRTEPRPCMAADIAIAWLRACPGA